MKYYQSIAVMFGYIIGVGMFGLPYLTNKVGVLSFLLLLVGMAFVQYFCHLIFASVILETKAYHRLPGYAGIYLGKFWKHLGLLTKVVGNYGSLLAYIVITGIFLNQLLAPYFGENILLYATVLFLAEALIIFFGVKSIGPAELVMTGLLFLVLGFLCVKGVPHLAISNYHLADWRLFFLPYGAMLFALDGSGAVPLAVKLLNRDQKATKKVIRISIFGSMFIILFFVLIITGISGDNTTPDALVGLEGILSQNIINVALLFGVLTMITSFLGVAEDLRESLSEDYKINKTLAWALTITAPFLLYLAGVSDLIQIISFTGAVSGSLGVIILLLIFNKLRKEEKPLKLFKKKPSLFFIAFLVCLFLAGMVYEVAMF